MRGQLCKTILSLAILLAGSMANAEAVRMPPADLLPRCPGLILRILSKAVPFENAKTDISSEQQFAKPKPTMLFEFNGQKAYYRTDLDRNLPVPEGLSIRDLTKKIEDIVIPERIEDFGKADVAWVSDVIPVGPAGGGTKSILLFGYLRDGTVVVLKNRSENAINIGGEWKPMPIDPAELEALRLGDVQAVYRDSEMGIGPRFFGMHKYKGRDFMVMQYLPGEMIVEGAKLQRDLVTLQTLIDMETIFTRLEKAGVSRSVEAGDIEFLILPNGRLFIIDSGKDSQSVVDVEALRKEGVISPNAENGHFTYWRQQFLSALTPDQGRQYLEYLRQANTTAWQNLLLRQQN
jgi:hypothetical protein